MLFLAIQITLESVGDPISAALVAFAACAFSASSLPAESERLSQRAIFQPHGKVGNLPVDAKVDGETAAAIQKVAKTAVLALHLLCQARG